MGMSPKKFDELVLPLIKIRGKNIKSRKTITLKDQHEYSLVIDCVHEPRPCEDCDRQVINRRILYYRFFQNRWLANWHKKCLNCERRIRHE